MNEKIARLISNLLHPLLSGLVLFIFISTLKNAMDFYQIILLLTLDFLIPIAFLYFLLKKKIIENIDISDVTKRKYFYVPSLLFLIFTLPLLIIFKMWTIIILMQIGLVIWIFLWAIISFYYKISGHVGGASFVYTSFYFLTGEHYWWIFLLLPILAWSRVRLKQHTVDQTIVGGVLGYLVSYLVFRGIFYLF